MESVQPIPKQSNFLIILLSILLIISCLIAGFFAWQTQKLVKELTAYRLQPTATQTPTPTPNPTADWKMYTSEKYNFSFKYPNDLNIYVNSDIYKGVQNTILITKENKQTTSPGGWAGVFVTVLPNPLKLSSNAYIQKEILSDPLNSKTKIKNIASNNVDISIIEDEVVGGNRESTPSIYISKNDQIIVISSSTQQYIDLSNQILSTFKFIESGANIEPISCTADAKICPDGSAVGRSGPKCEFAPCPTQKSITSPQP